MNMSYEEKDSDNFISVNTFGTIPRIRGWLQAKPSRLQSLRLQGETPRL